jgi:phosphate transport system protein
VVDAAPHALRPSLQGALHHIHDLVLEMGEMVNNAIAQATEALVTRNVELATEVVQGDQRVNARQLTVHHECLSLILTQAPVARDLREVLGLLHMSDELERMGDHCVNVARIARDLSDVPPLRSPVDVPVLARACADQVRDMLSAVVSRDLERARDIAARDDRVDRIYHRIVDDIFHAMSEDSTDVYPGTRLILVAVNLERIADRVTNLAEDLIFLETGNVEDLGR